MALVKCPECGLENVSSSAIACPSCGFPLKDNYDLCIARQRALSGAVYCEVLSGSDKMFFENDIRPGIAGKCMVFDILADYCVDSDGHMIDIKGDKVSGRWTVFENFLLAPAGPYTGNIPDEETFRATCSSFLVKCDNLSFYPNGTFSETISGKTSTGVYVRQGNLIALAEKNSLSPRVFIIKNHYLWIGGSIKKEQSSLLTDISQKCIKLASNADNLSIPIIEQRNLPVNDSAKDKKSVGGTVAKIWFWLILALVGGFYFLFANLKLLAALCFIVCPLIAICTYLTGPKSLHKIVDDIAKTEHDKKMNGGYICPNCGRKAGYPINVLDKGMSVGALGLASNKIGKSYQCENCGYLW